MQLKVLLIVLLSPNAMSLSQPKGQQVADELTGRLSGANGCIFNPNAPSSDRFTKNLAALWLRGVSPCLL
jgi:hypothetical protein